MMTSTFSYEFEKVMGPFGIPVYLKRQPEIIRCTSIALVNFVGAADDRLIGAPGVYHWFEHVPFRGTKNFPNGYEGTRGPISKIGGVLNAWTNPLATTFWATVPNSFFRTAVEVVTDLVANPLLTTEGIEAERRIIHQEIRDALSSPESVMNRLMMDSLWNDHPLSSGVLGTIESLDSMNSEVLQEARRKGYCRGRMAFFVSSSLPEEAILAELEKVCGELPANNLSPRVKFATYEKLQWNDEREYMRETSFDSSIMCLIFPLGPMSSHREVAASTLLCSVFSYGGLGSPLYTALREKNQLVYACGVSRGGYESGGYFKIEMKTSRDNLFPAQKAIRGLFKDKRLRSSEWHDTIKLARRRNGDMTLPNPYTEIREAISEVGYIGSPISNESFMSLVDSVSLDEIAEMIDSLDLDQAYTLTALGK